MILFVNYWKLHFRETSILYAYWEKESGSFDAQSHTAKHLQIEKA